MFSFDEAGSEEGRDPAFTVLGSLSTSAEQIPAVSSPTTQNHPLIPSPSPFQAWFLVSPGKRSALGALVKLQRPSPLQGAWHQSSRGPAGRVLGWPLPSGALPKGPAPAATFPRARGIPHFWKRSSAFC